MDNQRNIKYPSHLVLTAALSGGITIVLSLIYILLSIAAIIFRFNDCNFGDSNNGANYFWKTIISAYILDDDCESSSIARHQLNITGAYTVFVFATLTLSFSVLCLVTASVLIATIQDGGAARYLNIVVCAYIGSCFAAFVVDLTTATHFGIDHTTLSNKLMDLPSGSTSNYRLEVLRHGAFLMMTIGLKGYVAPVVHIVLLILLVVYLLEHRKQMKNAEHSIHKLGAVNAFDQPRKPDDNAWVSEPDVFSPFSRGAQVNNGFIRDDESDRARPRPPPKIDYSNSNRSYDRSDSWHRGQPSLNHSNRPFSYLEDIKRPGPMRPSPSKGAELPWNQDNSPWSQGPPVPQPDYSPQPRRLKSALKPGYL
uniref:Uncharacterized protein n=1 Tax=Heliothis virescens TaxID=7102 RepID=A0A2A4JLP5_HELVI